MCCRYVRKQYFTVTVRRYVCRNGVLNVVVYTNGVCNERVGLVGNVGIYVTGIFTMLGLSFATLYER